jgi:DNA-directed RNA polymerase subunit L
MAGYDVPHPLASNPVIYVRTEGSVKPEQALRNALQKARDVNKEFGKELEKALKEK